MTCFLLPHSPSNKPSPALLETLAQSCTWESIMVHNHDTRSYKTYTSTYTSTNKDKDKDGTITMPTCYFYMPSGEQVSYCAHAAMGAAYILHTRQSTPSRDQQPSNKGEMILQTAQGVQTKAIIQGYDVVELGIPKQHFQEQTVDDKVVERLLDQIGLTMDCIDVDAHVDVNADSDIDSDSGIDSGIDIKDDTGRDTGRDSERWRWPLLNSSVARYKTLIPISTLEQLHAACDPRDPLVFRDLCDSIDSTGVYLYSQVKQHANKHEYEQQQQQQQEYECRQFPRASGYPEDPATGIAASALACSLYQRGIGVGTKSTSKGDGGRYIMNQGTAMGKHSRCNVRVSEEEDMVFCAGTIAIDGEEYLDVDVDVDVDVA